MSLVGGRSTFGVCEPQNSKEGVGRLVYIICLQVPPRPPKETVERLFLFLSFQARCPAQNRRKPLRFLHFRNPKGCFSVLRLLASIHRYCQSFSLFWSAIPSARRPNEFRFRFTPMYVGQSQLSIVASALVKNLVGTPTTRRISCSYVYILFL